MCSAFGLAHELFRNLSIEIFRFPGIVQECIALRYGAMQFAFVYFWVYSMFPIFYFCYLFTCIDKLKVGIPTYLSLFNSPHAMHALTSRVSLSSAKNTRIVLMNQPGPCFHPRSGNKTTRTK